MGGIVERVKRTTPVRVLLAYGDAQGGNLAGALAFNAFLAMFPLIIGMLSLLGLVISDEGVRHGYEDAVASIFPGDAHDQILQALGGVRRSAGILGVVALLGLLWSGTNLFSVMEWALDSINDVRQRDLLRQRLMGAAMLVVFLVAVVVSVTATSVAAFVPLASIGGVVIGGAVMVGLLALIYRLVPNRAYSLREVLPGALVAGSLIELLTFVFPLYARISHGFGTYGQQFALFFVIAAWLGFLTQFLIIGAVYIRLRSGVPGDEGLLATPHQDSREMQRPSEAIDSHRPDQDLPSGDRGASPAPARPPAPWAWQNVRTQD